jgi:hypothetical protein
MRAFTILVVTLVGATASADSMQTAVESVPELGTVSRGRTRVFVRGDVPKARRKELVQLVDRVIADVERRFLTTPGDPHGSITLCLFSDARRYHQVASAFGRIPSDLGFYMPRERVGLANVGISVGNLRHELVHPLIDDDFPKVPAWLNEGLGALYGTARWNKDRFEFLVNYRLRDLQRALRDGSVPSLATLATSTYELVHGKDGAVYYALARYVLLYLERQGTLSKFYAEMRATSSVAAQKQLLLRYVDEHAFRTWAKALRR